MNVIKITKLAVFLCAALLLSCNLFSDEADARKKDAAYRIILLGDTHFDAEPDVYHKAYIEQNQGKPINPEFARNAEMWKERCPMMMKAAAKQVTPNTAFVIQLGDLVQGDCGNPDVHSKMLMDAMDIMKSYFPSVPFLSVTGNHDTRGTKALEAYKNTMPDRLSKELDSQIKKTTFYVTHGPDLFLFVDFERPDEAVIKDAFAKNPDARYKFVISHGPVIPFDTGRSDWMLYGRNTEKRAEMFDLFMKNNVIALVGHIHRISLFECTGEKGSLVQLMGNSVWVKTISRVPELVTDKPESYGEVQAKAKNQKGIALLDEYKPYLKRYWIAKGAGYFTLNISPEGVTADFYSCDDEKPCQNFKLR